MKNMDSKQKIIEGLLIKAEQDLANNSKGYEKKLMWYSLLGYGVISLLLISLISLVVGSVALASTSSFFLLLILKKKLFIPLFIMVWILFKSIFVRWPKPEGFQLTAKECPELFAKLDEIHKKLKTPKLHQVIVTPEFNAAIVQTPRFLAFGFTHNTLILGFELLLSLSKQEVTAVIAHELGHLSGNHSKFHGWIYRARNTWENMMYNLDQHNGWASAPLRWFFNWYSPRFSAYSFALAQLNEFEADMVAKEITSSESKASALIKTHVYSEYISEYLWKPFNEDIHRNPAPKIPPYSCLYKFINENNVPPEIAEKYLAFALKEKTNHLDTHPCLHKRLSSICSVDVNFSPTDKNAATDWLNNITDAISYFDKQWEELNLSSWEEEHRQLKANSEVLEDLLKRDVTSLSQEEHWNMTWLTEEFNKSDDLIVLYQQYNDAYPNDEKGIFALGRLYLEKNIDKGLALLEKAILKDEFIEPACHLAYSYLVDNERIDEASEWQTKAYNIQDVYRSAQLERQQITRKDVIIKSEVSTDSVEPLLNQIKQNDKVKEVWLAQKVVHQFTDSPVLVFALKAKRGFYLSDNLAEKILEKLEISSDETVFILTKGNDSRLFKKVLKVGEQLI
jgi:Zn-dependent protease with chaperone function